MEYTITVDDDGAEMTIKIAHPGARLKDEWDEVRPAMIRAADEAAESERRIAFRLITEGDSSGS